MSDLLVGISRRPKLLITAVDCPVGANLAACLGDRFDVIGLTQEPERSVPGWQRMLGPVRDTAALGRMVDCYRPDWVIHCGPFSAGSWDLAWRIADPDREVRRAKSLATAAARLSARVTLISTDAVFCGPRLFHGPDHQPRTRIPAALAALRIERTLASTGALVVRTHAFGLSPPGSEPGFTERAWLSLREGRPVEIDPDGHASPLLVSDLAELLFDAYRRGMDGLLHLAGAERVGMRRWVRELAQAMGLSQRDADAALTPAAPLRGPLRETALDSRSSRRGLERAMPLAWPSLLRFVEQAASGYRARLQSLPALPAAA
jgi:dTDP-4-dehydrorhamnose reductase